MHIFQALSVKGQESPILNESQTSIHCISKGELLSEIFLGKGN